MIRKAALPGLVVLLLAPLVVVPTAEARPSLDRAEILARVQGLLAEKDEYAAIGYVNSLGPVPVVGRVYTELVLDLHWKAKDLSATLVMGRAGILEFLTRGRGMQSLEVEGAAERAKPYLEQAKILAYNVGSFAWPGWGETALTLTPTEARAGLEAAKLNLRLAVELKRSTGALSNAHWLLGAHHMAARELDRAERSFAEAARLAKETDDAEGETMCHGYAAMALHLLAEDAKAKAVLDSAITELEKIGTEDAKVYLEQLRTVPDALRTWWKGKSR